MTIFRGNIQLDDAGRLRHFLTTEGLDRRLLTAILDKAEAFLNASQQETATIPLGRSKIVASLFFETDPSSQTSFEHAAERLAAKVVSPQHGTGAGGRGALLESLRDLESVRCDMLVVRHADSGAGHFIARYCAPHISVINAGDGRHAHPTQAMLDMFTIRRLKGEFVRLRVAIVGDVLNSRIARSQIHALNTLGTSEVRIIAPDTLLPAEPRSLGVHVHRDLETGLRDVDVVLAPPLNWTCLRGRLVPTKEEYFRLYGLNEKRLRAAKPDAIVLRPEPVDPGAEIYSPLADAHRSVVLQRFEEGIALRMAVMAMCMTAQDARVTERDSISTS